ncbi:MAG: cyclase family protein [Planctomycetota bacterium]
MLHDITPPVSPALAVWPGDTPPSREVLCDMKRGDNITLSSLRATVHLGAHVDAPSHYGVDAESIDQRSLDIYVGRCQVVRASGMQRGQRVGMAHLGGATISEPRVLIATGSYPDPHRFNEDFCGLEPALVDELHGHGVRLIGIDTPSVDLFSSKDLPAHQRFLANHMAILEGVVLSQVPDGVYELIALPLRLVGFDASPVRAVLREIHARGEPGTEVPGV